MLLPYRPLFSVLQDQLCRAADSGVIFQRSKSKLHIFICEKSSLHEWLSYVRNKHFSGLGYASADHDHCRIQNSRKICKRISEISSEFYSDLFCRLISGLNRIKHILCGYILFFQDCRAQFLSQFFLRKADDPGS